VLYAEPQFFDIFNFRWLAGNPKTALAELNTCVLAKEFTLLVVIAFLIAAPIAYYFMHQWLNNFAYRIPLS
jgi:hypothetical protein